MTNRILVCSKGKEPLFVYNLMRNGDGRALELENQIQLTVPNFNQKDKVSWPADGFNVEKYSDLAVGACEDNQVQINKIFK